MSDIFERLRIYAKDEGRLHTTDDLLRISNKVLERAEAAADEIERLRAEVARLDGQNTNLRKRLDLVSGWASSITHAVKGGALPLD